MSDKHKDTRNLLERIDNQPGLREQIEKLVTIAEAAATLRMPWMTLKN